MAGLAEHRSPSPGNWDWFAAAALCAALLTTAAFSLRCWTPSLWAQLTSEEQISNAVVAVLGSLVGTLIAVWAAYAILSHQLDADRQLELDLRMADVAHEVAGEISYWRDALPDPTRNATKGMTFDPSVVRALVKRRHALESSGVPAMEILRFVRVVEKDLSLLQGAYESINKRLPTKGKEWTKGLAVALAASSEILSEWQTQVVPHLDSLDAFAASLATWQPTQPLPPLTLPDAPSLVCSGIDIEKRLSASGYPVPRDALAVKFGLYDEPNAEAAREDSGEGDQ